MFSNNGCLVDGEDYTDLNEARDIAFNMSEALGVPVSICEMYGISEQVIETYGA
jgi:hypothetical protein